MLDNNLLDALPGYLLKMPSLETVHRHGNHNYFKSTFMWYHTDVNERILAVSGTIDFMPHEPESLQFWAAKAVMGSKVNFYADCCVTPVLKDYISDIYTLFNVCGSCNTAKLISQPGKSAVHIVKEMLSLHTAQFLFAKERTVVIGKKLIFVFPFPALNTRTM